MSNKIEKFFMLFILFYNYSFIIKHTLDFCEIEFY